ncbi:MAG: HEAT repeat domain-containing protein [Acidobacteriota bacterium]|jgi:hypothetical protein
MSGQRSSLLCAIVLALTLSSTLAVTAQTSALPDEWIDISATSPTFDDFVRAAQRAASNDELWVGYTFALREGVHVGCDDWRGRSVSFGRDSISFLLDREDVDRSSTCTQDFGFFLRFDGDADRVVEARLMTLRRAVRRLDGDVVWAGEMPVQASISWLGPAVLERDSGLRAAGADAVETRTRLLTAAAVHDSPGGVAIALAALDSDYPSELRKSGIFWTAQFGGDDGLQRLIEMAHQDGDAEVRKQSIFWLAQVAGERATAHLADIAEDDPETEVRQAAVFALSQSEDDAALDALIEIVRTHDNREVVKSALFWLGQSGDERAVALIEELLFGHLD